MAASARGSERLKDDSAGSRAQEPTTVRHRGIVDDFLRSGNAAQVARNQGVHEKTVRRVVKKFAPYVAEQMEIRAAKRQEAESARDSRLEGWLGATLETDLRRIDELTQSNDEGVALRALKIKFEIAAGLRVGVGRHLDLLAQSLSELEEQLSDPSGFQHEGPR
jgi:hypothetical protein